MWTILLVEDERELARVVGRELQAHGYRVVHAADGAKALRLHATGHPDLVILDWMLPGLDGLEVLRRIRASGGEAAAVPVLMLTARSEEVDRIVGLEVGADDYLTKPFSMRELVARVKVLFRRLQLAAANHDDAAEEILTKGELELDLRRYTASLGGRPVQLTVTEFMILHALIRHPGHVKTRQQLMDEGYPHDTFVSDRTIDSHIKRLRKKFKQVDESFDVIETLYGVGYRFKEM